MGWLKKTLAKVGMGNASLEIVLPDDAGRQGQRMAAQLVVTGGEVAQSVDVITLAIRCDYMGWEQVRTNGEQGQKHRRRRKTHTLVTCALPDAFTIAAGETRTFDVSVDLPNVTPLSLDDDKVWLEARLDIPMAKDVVAKASLTVKPDAAFNAVLDTLEGVGFRIQTVKREEVERGPLPFRQLLTLAPVEGRFGDHFRQLTLDAQREGGTLRVLTVFSRQGEGVGDMVGRLVGQDKVKRELVLSSSSSAQEVVQTVNTLLDAITQ